VLTRRRTEAGGKSALVHLQQRRWMESYVVFSGSRLFLTQRWSIRYITFHPPLGIRFRTTSISYNQSAKLLPDCFSEVYSVSQASFIFILRAWKEGADPCSSPSEDVDNIGNLVFITWMNESDVIDSPESNIELNKFLFTEEVLLLFLIHDQVFFSQGIPCPLAQFRLAIGV